MATSTVGGYKISSIRLLREYLLGTRIDLLREIDEWAKSPHEKSVFKSSSFSGLASSFGEMKRIEE
ncbi:hypothetical protein N7524_006429 [Penicillium chrysogenum]|nr:hypothetical protein N7524_006429 [Penicillium chrysogenum]